MAKKKFRPGDGTSSSSKFGQMIGEAFERVTITLIEGYLKQSYSEYEILGASEGNSIVTMEMLGGSLRQLDTVISAKGSRDPVALLETKWLKDARHHNDKGAWILQLREVKKKHATIRGAAAILAGYWTSGVAVVLMSEGGINMVWVATDEEIYSTLQEPLNDYLGKNSFVLDASEMRKKYPRPWDLANFIIDLDENDKLIPIAKSWLTFPKKDNNGNWVIGEDLIKIALNELLEPLPEAPQAVAFEISIQIETGNVIHRSFEDMESALDFVQLYATDPKAILDKIKPK